MSFSPFNNLNLSIPSLPGIPNPFSSKPQANETTFELVRYITEKEMHSYDYYDDYNVGTSLKRYRDLMYTVNIGYITSKYVTNIKDTGCMMIMISSQIPEGPNAIFCLARSDKNKQGDINTLVSSAGKCGDKIDIMWNPMEYPCILLKHNFTKKQTLKEDTKLRLGYNIKVIFI